jgi:cellulose biosynthesis protein BcsQ
VKTIALIAQKGGVGKTTLAVNLAVASGLRTAIFDLDQQESAAIWADRRKSDMPHVEFLADRRLAEGLKAAERGAFELAIIDTPPAAGPHAFAAAQAANLILIPCRPSLVDLDAIRRTAQLIKSTGVPAFVVFNAAPHSATTLLEDARVTPAELEERGILAPPEPPAVIPLKTHRRNAKSEGERTWPDYERCVAGAPPSKEGPGPDRSMADFFWCMMAAQRGWAPEETANKLLEVSSKAQERARLRDEGYALITAQNAAVAAQRNTLKRGVTERASGRS